MSLYNRGTSYYAVLNVPTAFRSLVGKRQLWVSLRTKNKQIEQRRYIVVMSDLFERLDFKGKTAKKMGYDKDEHTLDYDRSQAETFAYEYLLTRIAEERENCAGKPLLPEPYMERFAQLRSKYAVADYGIIERKCQSFLLRKDYPFPTESSKRVLEEAFMRAEMQFCDFMHHCAIGSADIPPQRLTVGVPSGLTGENIVSSPMLLRTPLKPDMTLDALAEVYNNQNSRKNKSADSKNRVSKKIHILQEILSKDKTVRSVTTEDLQHAVELLPFITKNSARSKPDTYNVLKDIERGKKHPTECIGSKTLGDYFVVIKRFFDWAVKYKYLTENPYDTVDVPCATNEKDEIKRLSFSARQLSYIFNAPIYTGCRDDKRGYAIKGNAHPRHARFWIPLLGIFTGARCNELCQLSPNDVRQIDDVWVISINDEGEKHVKTKAGIRLVPLHNELIKIGFLNYVKEMRKEKRLFPELRVNARGHYSDDISKWFGRFLDSLNKGIKAKADKFEEGHVFHSFRHTVRTEFRNNEVNPEFVTRIQGWERGSSLSEHYGEVSLKVLRETVNCKLKYDGLDLSHLYRE